MSRSSRDTWEQLKISYIAGAGLREIARKMNIPEGTVLAHANRKGWTQQIQAAKQETKLKQLYFSGTEAAAPAPTVKSGNSSAYRGLFEKLLSLVINKSSKAEIDSVVYVGT